MTNYLNPPCVTCLISKMKVIAFYRLIVSITWENDGEGTLAIVTC